jgi:hypothetical protein
MILCFCLNFNKTSEFVDVMIQFVCGWGGLTRKIAGERFRGKVGRLSRSRKGVEEVCLLQHVSERLWEVWEKLDWTLKLFKKWWLYFWQLFWSKTGPGLYQSSNQNSANQTSTSNTPNHQTPKSHHLKPPPGATSHPNCHPKRMKSQCIALFSPKKPFSQHENQLFSFNFID